MNQWSNLADTFLNWNYIGEVLPTMFQYGLLNTLVLALTSGVIGTVLGAVLAFLGVSRNRFLRVIARIYTDIFRSLPAVLVILVIGIGFGPILRELTGLRSPYPLGIAALGLMAAAYIGEIFRSGIQSVDKGQLEASRALGFGYGPAMRLIVIPQGIRRVLPALMNQFISLIKDSSLIFTLGLMSGERELFQIGQDFAANNGNLSPLVAAAIFYLALVIPLTYLVNYIDKRLREGRAQKAVPEQTDAALTKGAQA